MILDEALRDPVTEYFMGERTKDNETGNTRSLIHYVNTRLKAVNREWSCSKRMLQNDVAYFIKKGARLEPRFRRGHKRILRYINLEWKNPLVRQAKFLNYGDSAAADPTPATLPEGKMTNVTLRISGDEEKIRQALCQPDVKQRSTDTESGTVTLQVEIPVSPALDGIILSFGTDIEVLSPESLRSSLRRTINAMQRLYKREVAAKNPAQGDLFDSLF